MSFKLDNLTVRHLRGAATAPAALHALELAIVQGEQLALIGPSGAGKTTLLSTLACAHRPAAGALSVFGVDPWALPHKDRHRLRARLFLAPQTPPLPPRPGAEASGFIRRRRLLRATRKRSSASSRSAPGV